MSKIEVNQISSQCGSTLTIGQSGDTVTLASGATAAGFGSTGEVSWDTTKKTTGFTAVSGVGYFCDTNSAAFTVTLPATPSAGNVVAVSDYTGTFATNNLTIGRNGSNINGAASDYVIYQNNTTAQFIYVDATEGWKLVFTGASSNLESNFIVATGGCISYCGSCKIHTFTGPGTFCVSATGLISANNEISYMVVAGGGGGGTDVGGGGGAGGFREDKSPVTPYTASPLDGAGPITVTATAYPITVGAGGAGSGSGQADRGCNGSNSIFSTITSAGGGGGGSYTPTPTKDGGSGGSGGGGTGYVVLSSGGSGNTPPVSPSQGNNGGSNTISAIASSGGGGGGAGGVGADQFTNPGPITGYAAGGVGVATSITASPVTYSAGGRGASDGSPGPTSGSPNTGNGGDGGGNPPGAGSSGGSGIVVIRYKYQ